MMVKCILSTEFFLSLFSMLVVIGRMQEPNHLALTIIEDVGIWGILYVLLICLATGIILLKYVFVQHDREIKQHDQKIKKNQGINGLIKMLNDSKPQVRQEAIDELVRRQEVPAVKKFLVDHSDERMRRRAAIILGRIGSQEGKDSLIKLLTDECVDVQSDAAEALEKMSWGLKEIADSEKAVNFLISRLTTNNRLCESPKLLALTMKVLGETRNGRAVEMLIECLKDWDPNIQMQAAIALGKIGDHSAIPALQKLWRETPVTLLSVRTAASDAIRSIAEGVDPGGRSAESWLPWDHDIFVPGKPLSHVGKVEKEDRNESGKSEEDQQDDESNDEYEQKEDEDNDEDEEKRTENRQ